jgi:hypothetical protein
MRIYSAALVVFAALAASACRSGCPTDPESSEQPRVRLADCRCEPVVHQALRGPEDLALDAADPDGPRLLISAQDREYPAQPGAILALPLSDPEARVSRLSRWGRDRCSFHPHGIAVVDASDGRRRLYVVNHHGREDFARGGGCPPWSETGFRRRRQHSVEVYRIVPGGLLFEERLTDPLLANPNDLVGLPDGQLFVTTFPSSRGVLAVEALAKSLVSGVVHYIPGEGWHEDADGIRYANGIEVEIGADGKPRRLFVAGTRDDELHVYAIGAYRRRGEEGSTRCLHEKKPISIPGPDNVTWEVPGRVLLVASHPDPWAFLRHAGDWQSHRRIKRPSPSSIWRIPVDAEKVRPEHLICDAGYQLSAASVAVCQEDELFLGQVFGPSVLRCQGCCGQV